MAGDPEFWHRRYTQQVCWSLWVRRYIFDKISASIHQRILEVGCGSGAVLQSLAEDGFSNVIGLDIDYEPLQMAFPKAVSNADAYKIPFSHNSFEICLCHFFLLWVTDSLKMLKEMARVTKPGGWVIALAEPDYGGRIDFPSELEPLGQAQVLALQDQGADTFIGRKLKGLFTDSGFTDIQSGIISAEWGQDFNKTDFELEWSVLRKDLEGCFSPEELDKYYETDLEASREGRRILFVPIFYAFGRVPE